MADDAVMNGASKQRRRTGMNEETGKGLHEFERTYFERLRLAAQVILEAAPDLRLVTDPLEAELGIFKERVEFLLLLPEYAENEIPWRKMLNGE
jgi:hypothetical protein